MNQEKLKLKQSKCKFTHAKEFFIEMGKVEKNEMIKLFKGSWCSCYISLLSC